MCSGILAFVTAAAALAIGGCGGDDASAKSEPVQKCEDFATTWCQKSVGCLVMVGTLAEEQRAPSQEQCTDVAIAAAQCKKAISIGSSYSQCLSDIRAMDCSLWNVPEDQLSTIQLPAPCRGIIQLSQSQ
jgi:hypothetical protein